MDGEANWAKNLFSSDTAVILTIYDLIKQVLDPCSFITTRIKSVEDLYNTEQSIVTQTVAVYLSLVLCCFALLGVCVD